MRAELDSANGRAFDLAYMQGQVIDHQKTAILLQWEIGQGQKPELQRFAAETLPTVLAHLEIANNVWLSSLAKRRRHRSKARRHRIVGNSPRPRRKERSSCLRSPSWLIAGSSRASALATSPISPL
jgi:hypothetical protein